MKRTLYTTLLCSALLTACGGGGGSADEQAPLSAIDSSSNVATSSPTSGVTDSSSSGVTDTSSSGATDGAANTAPVASAGADLGVLVGSLATLDGSASNDADGDTLTYAWALVSSPTGSSASLSGANTVSPSFTPDLAGPYVVSLTVNDGKVSSAEDTVTVNAAVGNAAPVANAGADQNVNVGASVTLDGSDSSDANGDTLSYTWAFSSWPDGSLASLSDVNSASPTFTADVVGEYVLSLTVNDGTVDSAEDSVTVNASVGNAAPVANAGADQNVSVGASVTLDGSDSSDANGDKLGYAWSFTSRPDDSSATLSDANVVGPSFTADVAGTYVLSLKVNDGNVESVADTVTVTVGSTAPTGFGDAPPLQPPPENGLPKVQGDTLCEGYRVKGPLAIPGRLEVPAGQSCVLESGVTIDNVTLGAGATFYAQGVTVTNVYGENGAARVVIEDSVISNLELEFGVEITLRKNTISGAIRASSNTGLVYVADNTVSGQTELLTNTGGVTVTGNTVGGNLTCNGNDPEPTGGANVVGGGNVGQCAGL